jgi:hypothetical protein
MIVQFPQPEPRTAERPCPCGGHRIGGPTITTEHARWCPQWQGDDLIGCPHCGHRGGILGGRHDVHQSWCPALNAQHNPCEECLHAVRRSQLVLVPDEPGPYDWADVRNDEPF